MSPMSLRHTYCIALVLYSHSVLQFFACILYINFLMEYLCIPFFTNMSKQPLSFKTLVLSIFFATWPGMWTDWPVLGGEMSCGTQ